MAREWLTKQISASLIVLIAKVVSNEVEASDKEQAVFNFITEIVDILEDAECK